MCHGSGPYHSTSARGVLDNPDLGWANQINIGTDVRKQDYSSLDCTPNRQPRPGRCPPKHRGKQNLLHNAFVTAIEFSLMNRTIYYGKHAAASTTLASAMAILVGFTFSVTEGRRVLLKRPNHMSRYVSVTVTLCLFVTALDPSRALIHHEVEVWTTMCH